MSALNQRLRDLVRWARGELFREGLITQDEYVELATEHGAVERLQDYDKLRAESDALRQRAEAAEARVAHLERQWAATDRKYHFALEKEEEIGVLYDQATARAEELAAAIRTHRAQKADDRCIEDDDQLYERLGDGIKCDRRVGDKAAMLENCRRFLERRCEGGTWPTYQQLEARIEELEEVVAFYADPETYFAIGFFPDPPSGDFVEDFDDTGSLGVKPGKRARAALARKAQGDR